MLSSLGVTTLMQNQTDRAAGAPLCARGLCHGCSGSNAPICQGSLLGNRPPCSPLGSPAYTRVNSHHCWQSTGKLNLIYGTEQFLAPCTLLSSVKVLKVKKIIESGMMKPDACS